MYTYLALFLHSRKPEAALLGLIMTFEMSLITTGRLSWGVQKIMKCTNFLERITGAFPSAPSGLSDGVQGEPASFPVSELVSTL
jgi:hypothetical protein